jgi:hypothetical protein
VQAGQAHEVLQQAQVILERELGLETSVPALRPLNVAKANAATIPISSRRIIFRLLLFVS